MMRKLVLSMLVVSTFVLATSGSASAASAVPYSILQGDSMEFIVHGTNADLIPVTPGASVGTPAPFLGVLATVTVSCAASAQLPCAGLLVVT